MLFRNFEIECNDYWVSWKGNLGHIQSFPSVWSSQVMNICHYMSIYRRKVRHTRVYWIRNLNYTGLYLQFIVTLFWFYLGETLLILSNYTYTVTSISNYSINIFILIRMDLHLWCKCLVILSHVTIMIFLCVLYGK